MCEGSVVVSYEPVSKKVIDCPCGKGYIIDEYYSNDWNQSKNKINIGCQFCKKDFHIESLHVLHGDHVVENYYLVPNGETIIRNFGKNNILYFPDQLCLNYPLKDLIKSFNEVCSHTNISKLHESNAKSIAKMCKNALGTAKIQIVRENLHKAIQMYNSLSVNFDSETERISNIRSKSIYIPL